MQELHILVAVMGGGVGFIMGEDGNISFIVGRGVVTPLFYEDLPHIAYPHPPPHPFHVLSTTFPLLLSPPTPIPTALSVVMFLWLNGWSCHFWCAILLNNNMDLQMPSLGTLASEGPWYVFYATRCPFDWGLTHVIFYGYSDLISHT